MSTLLRVADRLIGRPLLISPHKAEVIFDVIAGRLPIDAPSPEALRSPAPARPGGAGSSLIVRDGVAHIVIDGSLVNRGAWIGSNSGLVSYEGLHAQVSAADVDKAVRGVVLDINSAGGEVGGLFALCDRIRALATRKPLVAFVNDLAASAAYAIACQAGRIVVSPSSIVGSIGVVLLHMDRSDQLAKAGMKPTLIHAGAHKVDGNPFGPLPDDVRERLQGEVNALYGLLLDTVARGRGIRLSKAAARATEARVFMGKDAIAAGLADEIATFDAVMAALARVPQAPPSAAAVPAPAAALPSPASIVRQALAQAGGAVDPRLEAEMMRLAQGHPALLSQPAKLFAAAEATIQAGDDAARAKVRASWSKAIARVNP